jgi:transposase-like protein
MSYRRYTKDFKQKVLRELGTGESVAAVARRYAVSRQLIYEWQQKQRDGALDDTMAVRETQLKHQIGALERKVGQLTMENEFLKKTLERLEQRYPQSGQTAAPSSSNRSKQRGARAGCR